MRAGRLSGSRGIRCRLVSWGLVRHPGRPAGGVAVWTSWISETRSSPPSVRFGSSRARSATTSVPSRLGGMARRSWPTRLTSAPVRRLRLPRASTALTAVTLILGVGPAGAPARAGTPAPPPRWVAFTAALDDYARGDSVVGASVLVLRDGRVLAHHEYGVGDRDSRRPPDAGAVYHWASITKTLPTSSSPFSTRQPGSWVSAPMLVSSPMRTRSKLEQSAVSRAQPRPTVAPKGQRPAVLGALECDSLLCFPLTIRCPSPAVMGRGLALSSFS